MAQQGESASLLAPALLLVSAIVGFALSNSGLSEVYYGFLNTKIQLALGSKDLINKSLLLLINDGLMAVFFLFIGLELKREIVVGELSNVRQAIFPIFAAIGGMVVPAAIYLGLNSSGEGANGWAIPMATDIAFALGILAVLGTRVPASLKVLLAAVAIVDDLGAILVIAIFYTAQVDIASLGFALVPLVICVAMNRMGVTKVSLYILFGIPTWYLTLKSGVHATIAGVLLAMTIPLAANKKKSTAKLLADIFRKEASPLDSPAVFLEKSLVPWVGFLIIPVFAFSNSGVALSSFQFGAVSLGVIFGLAIGKPLGVVGAAYLSKVLQIANLPKGVSWLQLTGVGFLAGVGFTMSLFISSLAFESASLNNEAKIAILVGSLIAGLVGAFLLILKPSKA